jgi:transposase
MGRKKINEATKHQIIGMMKLNVGPNEISKKLNISASCASRTIKRFKETGDIKDKFRSGRPRKTSIQDDRLIFRLARIDPKASSKKIAQKLNDTLNNHITSRTVSNRLIERKLYSYVAIKKPFLKPTDRMKRINFCRQLLRLTDKQLNSIIYSDESNFEIINRKSKVLIRRFSNEKYSNRAVVPRLQGGGGSIGIWGCITFNGTGLHTLYDGRLNAERYIEILENALIPTRDLYFVD